MKSRSEWRGNARLAENAARSGTLLERLETVLQKIEHHPGDAPVAVSAGFLRWVAWEAENLSADADDTDGLRAQIEHLSREVEDARQAAMQLHAFSSRLSEQLQLAETRNAALNHSITVLRQELDENDGVTVKARTKSRR
jgi:hypothetical protein